MKIMISPITTWSNEDPWVPEIDVLSLSRDQLCALHRLLGHELIIQAIPRGTRVLVKVTSDGVQPLTPSGNPLPTELGALAYHVLRDLRLSDEVIIDGILDPEFRTYTVHDVIYARSMTLGSPLLLGVEWVVPTMYTATRIAALTVFFKDRPDTDSVRVAPTLRMPQLSEMAALLDGTAGTPHGRPPRVLIKRYLDPLFSEKTSDIARTLCVNLDPPMPSGDSSCP